MKRYTLIVFLILSVFTIQCSTISKITGKIAGKIPGLAKITRRDPPITTSLTDAVMDIPFLDDFNPQVMMSMNWLLQRPNGGFLLRPGLFEFNLQSYCLHAGTYVPGGGDGYVDAPLKGPWADIIRNVLHRSVDHQEVSQQDIQVLLWAIIARTKINDMSPENKLIAAKLLKPKEIAKINGGMLGLIPKSLKEEAFGQLPYHVQTVLEAEANLREMLTTTYASYETLERIAVLTGIAPPGEGSREIPRGRWSYHSDGYFIRYFPSGYTSTHIQLYVPERYQIERDQLGRIILITDEYGNRIETQYDDTIESVTINGDSGIQGYAFRSIRFVSNEIYLPDEIWYLESEWNDVGWTLIGVPSGKGRIKSSSNRFSDLNVRYDWAKTHKKELEQLNREFDHPGTVENMMDIGHYAIALEKVIGSEYAEDVELTTNPIELVKMAWQYTVCKRYSRYKLKVTSSRQHMKKAGDFGEPTVTLLAFEEQPVHAQVAGYSEVSNSSVLEFTPSGVVAVPGNTSRQRLAISGRPSDKKIPPCGQIRALKRSLRHGEWMRGLYEEKGKTAKDAFELQKIVQKEFKKMLEEEYRKRGIKRKPSPKSLGKYYFCKGGEPIITNMCKLKKSVAPLCIWQTEAHRIHEYTHKSDADALRAKGLLEKFCKGEDEFTPRKQVETFSAFEVHAYSEHIKYYRKLLGDLRKKWPECF